MSKTEYLIVSKGTKFAGSAKLGLNENGYLSWLLNCLMIPGGHGELPKYSPSFPPKMISNVLKLDQI